MKHITSVPVENRAQRLREFVPKEFSRAEASFLESEETGGGSKPFLSALVQKLFEQSFIYLFLTH